MQGGMYYMTAQERVIWQLRALYESMGYAQYPMRRFEEYELYQQNKAFLKGESVLAFPSPDGRMLALKPDVTLSIVKHTRVTEDTVEKLYYNESVFRAEKSGQEFREIKQMGIEYLGDTDLFAALEVLTLAEKSLGLISDEHVLELGHMGFVGALLAQAGLENGEGESILSFIRQKNVHELTNELARLGVSGDAARAIARLPLLSGAWRETILSAREICLSDDMTAALSDLELLLSRMSAACLDKNLRVDFSIVNDMNYYNGLVMRGYVRSAPRAVLSGGRYDRLMRRMGKRGGGMGFAMYLDEFARLFGEESRADIDTLVLYDASADISALSQALSALAKSGERVMAAKMKPADKKIGRVLRFTPRGMEEVDIDA